jgi:hypothetical protein
MLQPWRSEADAFRVLIWFVVVMAVLIGLILAVRALT